MEYHLPVRLWMLSVGADNSKLVSSSRSGNLFSRSREGTHALPRVDFGMMQVRIYYVDTVTVGMPIFALFGGAVTTTAVLLAFACVCSYSTAALKHGREAVARQRRGGDHVHQRNIPFRA